MLLPEKIEKFSNLQYYEKSAPAAMNDKCRTAALRKIVKSAQTYDMARVIPTACL
jgi:hypothetical protein